MTASYDREIEGYAKRLAVAPRRFVKLTGYPAPAEQLRDQLRSSSGATFIRGGRALTVGAQAELQWPLNG
jgi:hypothetical protein